MTFWQGLLEPLAILVAGGIPLVIYLLGRQKKRTTTEHDLIQEVRDYNPRGDWLKIKAYTKTLTRKIHGNARKAIDDKFETNWKNYMLKLWEDYEYGVVFEEPPISINLGNNIGLLDAIILNGNDEYCLFLKTHEIYRKIELGVPILRMEMHIMKAVAAYVDAKQN